MKCKFCDSNLRYDPNGQISIDRYRREVVVSGPWVTIDRGVDMNGKIFLVGSADDETDFYYPKFCPECGRYLEEERVEWTSEDWHLA